MDNDMVMALGGGGILLVGFVAMMVLRKRKQAKEMAAAFNETQVGT
jgi:LPXTG-motif cell wall-anchored protein